jgi:hypothetical protein
VAQAARTIDSTKTQLSIDNRFAFSIFILPIPNNESREYS